MASIAIASMERFRTKLSNKPTIGNMVAQSKAFYAAGGEVRLQSAIGQKWAKRVDGQAEAN
jgi:hypothetical protein